MVLAISAVVLGSCGGDAGQEETSTTPEATGTTAQPDQGAVYVGRVGRGDLFVGIVSDGKSATGFVCDNKVKGQGSDPSDSTGLDICPWYFNAPLRNNMVTLVGYRVGFRHGRGPRLAATLGDDGARGTITIGKKRHRFTAAPVTGNAGLYRVVGSGRVGEHLGEWLEAGWIMLEDGSQRGQWIYNDGFNINSGTVTKLEPGTEDVKIPCCGTYSVQRVGPDFVAGNPDPP